MAPEMMTMNRREALAALAALPGVARIERANPAPDDVIVVETDQPISLAGAEHIERKLKAIWPDRRVIVLQHGLKLKLAPGGGT